MSNAGVIQTCFGKKIILKESTYILSRVWSHSVIGCTTNAFGFLCARFSHLWSVHML